MMIDEDGYGGFVVVIGDVGMVGMILSSHFFVIWLYCYLVHMLVDRNVNNRWAVVVVFDYSNYYCDCDGECVVTLIMH